MHVALHNGEARVGDTVRIIVDYPSSSPLKRGDIVTLTAIRFDTSNAYEGISVRKAPYTPEWYIQAHHVELVTGSGEQTVSTHVVAPTTLPTDSKERKEFPLHSGLLRYFPAALAGVAKTSKVGNDKHNPGEEMHHARGKSMDHGDCVLRHLMDTEDLLAAMKRGDKTVTKEQILAEVSSLAWRALALSQELHEQFGAPLAPGAKK
jgi:hypothetical protein